VGRGTRDITFADAGDSGAQFYLFSAPAHTTYPTTLVLPDEGTVRELGDQVTSNRRTLTQYIHENGVQSCQVVMGVTQLHPGSMWNTMPAHTHDRRTECYLYFDLPTDARVVHLMGEPSETRHVVVADRQAVISPSWSVHSGVGTAAYSFIWAMAGENKSFDDMDPVPPTSLL
jgi:4-deoxy-L-threo-5-hexosulose-uronate ketol-isomerase